MSQAKLYRPKKVELKADRLEWKRHTDIVPPDEVIVGDRLLYRPRKKEAGVFEEVMRVIRMPKGTMAILKNGRRRFLGNTYRKYTIWR